MAIISIMHIIQLFWYATTLCLMLKKNLFCVKYTLFDYFQSNFLSCSFFPSFFNHLKKFTNFEQFLLCHLEKYIEILHSTPLPSLFFWTISFIHIFYSFCMKWFEICASYVLNINILITMYSLLFLFISFRWKLCQYFKVGERWTWLKVI